MTTGGSETRRPSIWPVVQAVLALGTFGLLLFYTRSILNPVVLFVILWALLLPFRGREGHSVLLAVAGVLTALWVLIETGSVMAPFFLALILAYILDPLVDFLESRGLSRPVAIIALTIPALGILGVVVFVVIPSAFGQLGQLLDSIPVLVDRVGTWIEELHGRLEAVRVPLFDGSQLAEQLRGLESGAIVDFLQQQQAALGQHLWVGAWGVGRGIGSALTILGYVVLTPVLTFYLIRDWDRILDHLVGLVPEHRRERLVSFFEECDELVAGYLRGQLLVATTIGVLIGVGLALARFPYAASIGLVAGVLSLVPYVGIVLSLLPAIFIALVSGNVAISLLKIAVVFGIVQLLDGSIISPKIIGESVGIHPVWVVLALTLGGYFFGVVGLLIGVPLAALAKLLIVRGLDRYRESAFFQLSGIDPGPG